MKGSSSVCPHGSYYGQRGSYCSLGHHCSRANYCLPASHCATSASNTVRHDLGLLFYCSKPLLLLVSLLMYLPPSACGELHVLGLENIVCRCQHIICIFQLKILTAVLYRTTTQQVCNQLSQQSEHLYIYKTICREVPYVNIKKQYCYHFCASRNFIIEHHDSSIYVLATLTLLVTHDFCEV